MRSPRLSVGIIGDDIRGVAVVQALLAAGHSVVARSIPPEDRADQVDALLPGVAVRDIPGTIERADVLVLASHGDALETVLDTITATAERLGEKSGAQRGKVLCCFEPLDPLRRGALGALGLVSFRLVPMLSLMGSSLDVPRMRPAHCAVVAPATVWPIGQTLVAETGMTPFYVDADNETVLDHTMQDLTATLQGVTNTLGEASQALGHKASAALSSWLVDALRPRDVTDDD